MAEDLPTGDPALADTPAVHVDVEIDPDPTPPMGLFKGEGVRIDNQIATLKARIDTEHAWVETLLMARQARDAYQVSRVDWLRNWVFLFGGIAFASLIAQLVRIVTVLVLKNGS